MGNVIWDAGFSFGRRRLRAAMATVGGAIVALLALAGAASAADAQSAQVLQALANPLDARELDQVRGQGLTMTPTTATGGMELGIILWDEYRGRPPSQGGGGISSVSTTTPSASGATFTFTSTNYSGPR